MPFMSAEQYRKAARLDAEKLVAEITAKLDPDVKTKWVEALTSGEYEQGKGELCDAAGKFCCLGVLTNVYITETGDGEWRQTVPGYRYTYGTDGITLPNKVRRWAGLPVANTLSDGSTGTEHGDVARALAAANDNDFTFADIAQIIQEKM